MTSLETLETADMAEHVRTHCHDTLSQVRAVRALFNEKRDQHRKPQLARSFLKAVASLLSNLDKKYVTLLFNEDTWLHLPVDRDMEVRQGLLELFQDSERLRRCVDKTQEAIG
jgi:hypothetical protein